MQIHNSYNINRTAGFPSTAGRLAFQVAPSPMALRLSAPGVPCASRRFASALRALRGTRLVPRSVSGRWTRRCTAIRGVGSSTPEVLAPVWVILSQAIYAYSTSSVPLAGTSQFHRSAIYTGGLRCAGAPRRPTTVPCFRCSFPVDMPPSTTSGSPSAAFAQFFANGTSLRRNKSDSALPFTPSSASDGKSFRGFTDSLSATACRFACLPGGSDWAFPQPPETFTPELSAGRSPFPLSSIAAVATEQAPPAGLAPTGTSTSIAALCYRFQMCSAYGDSTHVGTRPIAARKRIILLLRRCAHPPRQGN